MKDTAKASARGSTQSYRYPKRASGQEDCVTCRTGTSEEHLHSQHVKPREVAAHLEVKPASKAHITTNLQTWSITPHKPAGPAPKYELKRKGITPAELQPPSDLRVPHDDMVASSKLVQAKLSGMDQGDFTN